MKLPSETAAWQRCESPIEQILCTALLTFLGCESPDGDFSRERLPELGAACGGEPCAFLFAQHPVAGYRLDFLLVAINPEARRARLLGIECDGRAYHAAPEQRDRDRKRDAIIKETAGAGFSLRRVSGADLRNKVPNLMLEVTDWLAESSVLPRRKGFADFLQSVTSGAPTRDREPYRDEAAEDDERRRRFEAEGFI